MNRDFPHLDTYLFFVTEREAIRQRREAGEPPPWTSDRVLRAFRFTNICREHDRTTKWLAANWREPQRHHWGLWFAMAVARIGTNHVPTMQELGYPPPYWDTGRFITVLRDRKARGLTTESAAYVIRAGNSGEFTDKPQYLFHVLDQLWQDRDKLQPQRGQTLRQWCDLLAGYYGRGTFYAGQVAADMRHVEPLLSAPDAVTFAVSGPGSRAGMNCLLGCHPKTPWDERDWYACLLALAEAIRGPLADAGITLHNQDVQNTICEFSKYWGALNGKPPKRRYQPPAPPPRRGFFF
jgi:hypothetical protein